MKDTIKNVLKTLVPVQFRSVVKATFRTLYYFGIRYNCPICNSHLRTFLPFGYKFAVLNEKMVVGGGYRLKVLCPVCGSTDRERLVYLYLVHKTEIFEKPTKLLHVAPESQLGAIFFANDNIDYTSADLYSGNVMVEMDVTDIQYPDNSVDAIICNHVLEHVVDDRRAMRELYRILRPGSLAILQVPLSLSLHKTYEDFSIISPRQREEFFGQWDHVKNLWQ